MAERDKALLNLSRTVVRAPHDGIISQTSRLQVGNITPSGVPALSLVQRQRPGSTPISRKPTSPTCASASRPN